MERRYRKVEDGGREEGRKGGREEGRKGGMWSIGTARSRTSRRLSMLTHIMARNANQKRSGCANSFLSTTTCSNTLAIH